MSSKVLPPELRSLIHHVELNQSGWWNKALQQLILYALWLNDGIRSAGDIGNFIAKDFSFSVDAQSLTDELESLINSAKIVNAYNGGYKLAEHERSVIASELKKAEDIENRARQKFMECVAEACPSIDPETCWNDFNDNCLVPFIMDMGARTYELLSEGTLSRSMTFEDTEFFRIYGEEYGETLYSIIDDYLSLDDDLVREFVLRTLDAAFFLEASGLQNETLHKLTTGGNGQAKLELFLDTNFLFSVMGFHENPANQSVASLLDVLNEVANLLSCKLYVLPTTIDEFRRTLSAGRDNLKGIDVPSVLIAAALASGRFSGLEQRYFEVRQLENVTITPEDYFDPYLSNPVAAMRDRGVELFNSKTDDYRSRQSVIDGINWMWDLESNERQTTARYRAIEHDMILWHFVKDRRPNYIDSTSEAVSWVVTIDHRLMRYDRQNYAQHTSKQVCVLPEVLVQMLRFWLPRTEAFEKVVLESLRIPFIFRSFDVESEKVAINILKTLSRFELGDLSDEAITEVLMDKAVNAGFGDAATEQDKEELIKLSLSSRESELKTQIDEMDAQIEKQMELSERQSEELRQQAGLLKQGQEERQELENKLVVLDERDAQIEKQVELSEHQSEQLRRQEKLLKQEQEKRQELENQLAAQESDTRKAKFIRNWVIFPTAIAIAINIIAVLWVVFADFNLLKSALLIGLPITAGILAILGVVDWQGRKVPEIEKTSVHQNLRNFRKMVYGFFGAVLVGIIVRLIWYIFEGGF